MCAHTSYWPRLAACLGLLVCLGKFLPVAVSAPHDSSIACPHGDYLCLDGDCIQSSKRCDGISDCRNGDDELGCELIRCEAPEFFRCENYKCIAHSFVCDGENDCGQWEDEKNCHLVTLSPVQSNCTEDEFRCLDKTCIPDYMVCDGDSDCMDGSDEILGCSLRTSCHDGFMCKNKYCIPLEFRCDGDSDCNDGSDEEGCVRASNVVPMSECLTSNRLFPCADRASCIEIGEVCDGKVHCLDGSDEGGQCGDLGQCKRLNCTSSCFRTPTGPVCTCARGSNLVNGTCVDVNECEHYGICDQRCVNLKGSYTCSCDPGYKLQDDKRTCKVEGGEAMMVFGAGSSIRSYYLSSRVLVKIAKDQGQVAGIGYDGTHIYWTNVKEDEESIMRCDEDGSDPQVIVTAGLGLPEDLAVDWITHNIYFTDSEMKHIGVCTSDGVSCTVLVNEDYIDKPRSIALNPTSKSIYWSDWGVKPMIASSGMDGSSPIALVVKDIVWPNGLSVDYHNDRIYWVDAKRQKIESIKMDGSDRRMVLEHVLKHPFDIAVFEDMLYWSDWQGQQIQSCNKFTGKNHSTIIKERKSKVYGVHIFHSSMQHKNISNPCETSACSHMCLLAPNPLGYSCACREDGILAPDKHTCRALKKTEIIYIAAGQTLVRIEPRTLGKLHYTLIPITAIHDMGPITYDSVQGKIVIYDIAQKHIYSYNPETAQLDVILANAIGHISDMDYDHLGGNLYWTDTERGTVEVMSLSTKERAVLARDLRPDIPISLTVVPEENALFVAFYGENLHIDRLPMNGITSDGSRTHFIENNLFGPYFSMMYDQELHRLFWSDSGNRIIESASLDAVDRHETRSLDEIVNDISGLASDIYWVDRHSGHLHWTNKYNSISRSKKMDVGLSRDIDHPHIVAVRGKRVVSNHPCQDNNGNCSHVCLAVTKSAVCACPDGLTLRHDNRTCVTPITCAATQFKCKSDNTCIVKTKKCNGKKDCPNGEDEMNCGHSCSTEQFACKNGQCVDAKKRCDNTTDCADNSDELNCSVHCDSQTQFACKSGDCISSVLRCNEVPDCDDGSDEQDCEDSYCDPERSFRCLSGACIPKKWECDEQVDCPDGSDEHAKCPPKSCGSSQFECKNNRCVDKSLKCDLNDDCGDNSDEDGCEYTFLSQLHTTFETNKPIECFAGEFRCDSNGACVSVAARCNGTAECLAGEDEFDCDGCHGHEFKCKNGNCIPTAWLCDQTDDCKDGSDEHIELCNVQPSKAVVNAMCGAFRCPSDGKCLPWSMVCDLHQDCSDGADEGGSCAASCSTKNPCSGRCVRTPHGPKCTCHSGYQLAGDGRSCEDVDECILNDPCDQFCENTEGSYVCKCGPNFALRSDMISCKSVGAPMEYVFSSGSQIRRSSSSLQNVTVIANTIGLGVSGLDVDSHSKTVFWSTEETGEIIAWSLTTRTMSVIRGLGVPGKLAVDWVTDNVYFADKSDRGVIHVCNVKAEKCARVSSVEDGSTITSIVVDPQAGLLFWSKAALEYFTPPLGQIMACDMAGRDVKVLESNQIGMVASMAVDMIKRRIYWADQSIGVIQSMDYFGHDRVMVRSEEVVRPVDLTLFEGHLLWLSGETGKMMKCKINHATECESTVLASNAKHLRVLQEANQPTFANPCAEHSCSYLCVLIPNGTACLCKDGKIVNGTDECSFERSMEGDATFKVGLPTPESTAGGTSAISVLGPLAAVAIVLIIIAAVVMYTRGRTKKIPACPISLGLAGKGSKANDGNLTGFQFNNQSFGMEQCIRKTDKSVKPGQHEYVNPQMVDDDGNDTYHDFSEENFEKDRLIP